ncbi:MAG: carboxylesterase family protein [Chitinophagales bacterium]|nr:carboxylesterase family protein [Chitinophagales bacterium]
MLLRKCLSIILIVFLFCVSVSIAQLPPGAFLNEVYSGYNVTNDIVYGHNTNFFTGIPEDLKLDLYEPNEAVNYRRPLLVYIHGGGFTGGDKTTDKAVDFGEYFAKRGFVVASINYRLGIELDGTTVDNFQTTYMATQDAKSAIRFFKDTADQYCLDTAAFFVTGTSAGGVLALTCAYWDQPEANAAVLNTDTLGLLDASSGNVGFSSHINSVISCWGGITDTTWLQYEVEPNLLFHGTEDSTIPYMQGYNQDSLYLYGGFIIHRASLEYGVESYLKPFVGFGHGLNTNSPQFDTLLMMTDTFIYSHLPPNIGSACAVFTTHPVSATATIVSNIIDGDIILNNKSSEESYNGIVSVYDAAGQLMISQQVHIKSNARVTIRIPSVPTGLYFLKIHNAVQTTTHRLFIISQ